MRLIMILFLWSITGTVVAQDNLFPGKTGDELLDLVVSTYKPALALTYGPTRDSMYLHVYRDNDRQVTCHYTGLTRLLPDNVDPSAHLYNDDDPLSITAEHIYPQSKGAGEEPARSDMHNLIPVISRVNSARSNYPFGEIPDEETDHWYLQELDLSTAPNADRDLYSEQLNGGFGHPGRFEPQEAFKGDVARAVFYFYTMYKEEADDADPDFFWEMKDILLEWHAADPVDALEAERNLLKALFQEGQPNPFILDCSLVFRAYGDPNSRCSSLTDTQLLPDHSPWEIFPNPVTDLLHLGETSPDQILLLDSFGRQVKLIHRPLSGVVDVSELTPGPYLLYAPGLQQMTRFIKSE